MRAVIIGVSILCALLIGGAVFLSTRETGPKARILPISADYTKRLEDGGWVRGAADPTVTLVEYADLQCPGCAAMQSIIDEAYNRTLEYTQFVYRHYPLPSHNKAQLAARAAEAAGRQGKFWPMTQIIFANQASWVDQTSGAFRRTLTEYADSLDINTEQFLNDIDDSGITEPIVKDKGQGDEVGITATPTLILNGTPVSSQQMPRSADELVALIEAARGVTAQQ